MQSPDRIDLPCGPDGTAFDQPWMLDFEHQLAITFCILEGGSAPVVLINRQRPHMFIYNALQRCEPDAGMEQWKKVLSGYGVEKMSGRLTRQVIENFQEAAERCHGFPRYEVTSGRIWKGLREPGGETFHVMVFWNKGAAKADGAPAVIAKALRFRGPTYLAEAGESEGQWSTLG